MKHCLVYFACCSAFFCHATGETELNLCDIFTVKSVHDEQELATLNARCHDFDLALEFVLVRGTHELQAFTEYNGEKIPVSRGILEDIYNEFLEKNPYSKKKATVRILNGDGLCEGEQKALIKRMLFCLEAMQKLLDICIEPEQLPTVALCCSGGGYRALLSSSGIMKGLHDTGILNVCEYFVALSGSTWTLAAYAHSQEKFKDFYQNHLYHVYNGFLRMTPSEIMMELKSSINVIGQYCLRKMIFKEHLSIVDLYGYCIALDLLGEEALKNYFSLDLSAQIQQFSDGLRPLPVYTAAIPQGNDQNYYWLEFTPWEVGSQDMGYAVPTWSYGRFFKRGESQSSRPPLTTGFLMGTFGSAMTASFEELCRLFNDAFKKIPLFSSVKLLADATTIGDTRFFPAEIANFTYKIENAPCNKTKNCTVIDAGININIPLRPLFYLSRSTDVIIVCDASGDILGAPELKLAENYARDHKIPFPTIDYTDISKKAFSIFDDGPESNAPIIIYIPMVANANYSESFDPQNYLGTGKFMNTLNFEYTKEQALTLAGLFEHAAHEAHDSILEVLKEVIKRKTNN